MTNFDRRVPLGRLKLKIPKICREDSSAKQLQIVSSQIPEVNRQLVYSVY